VRTGKKMSSTDDSDDLGAACRDLYQLVGSNFMLPPMIRRAERSDAGNPRYCYTIGFAGGLRFIVEFDRAYVESADLPMDRLPLRFAFELLEPEARLRDGERAALIRAFLLGVRMPITVSRSSGGLAVSLQLSETYFFDCGEVALEAGVSHSLIRKRIASELFLKSEALFADPGEGYEFWRTRVEQQLLERPMPEADAFWPERDSEAPQPTAQIVSTPPVEEATQDAAFTVLLPAPSVAVAKLPVVLPVMSAGRHPSRRRAQVAGLLAAGIALAFAFRHASTDYTVDAKRAVANVTAAPVEKQATPPSTQQASLAAVESPVSSSVEQRGSAKEPGFTDDATPAPDARPKLNYPVAKKDNTARRPDRRPSARTGALAHPRWTRPSNPIAAIGQVMKTMTTSLSRNLQKITYSLSPDQR
jgi:hypothetical protein